MAIRYYTGTGDREKGPFTLKQLRSAVQDASLPKSTLVRAEDETTRKPVGELLVEHPAPSPRPRPPAPMTEHERIRLGGFCDKCVADTTDQSPWYVLGGGVGTRFLGESKRCHRCESVVRVVWLVVFLVPLFPMGTYRYRKIDGNLFSERFVARRLRPGRPGEVRPHGFLIAWGVVLVVVVYFVVLANRSH